MHDQMNQAAPGTEAGELAGAPRKPAHKESLKETFISIVIAFVLAFVFRGFVVEAFVIPTGSMAPTLMGAHMKFRGPESGYTWPVGPWHMIGNEPDAVQGRRDPVRVHDPMTGQLIERRNVPRLAGDRILVLKYLYAIAEPRRFDVVVFKNPSDPSINYIKRLLGLPGEEVALVDGDVFVRRASGAPHQQADAGSWSEPGWTIARKSAPVQRAVWQTVFDSRYTPLNPVRDGRTWFKTPWTGRGGGTGWDLGGRMYTYTGSGPTELAWDSRAERYRPDGLGGGGGGGEPERWAIDDRYPYDESEMPQGRDVWRHRFPVSDVRLRAGIQPGAPGTLVRATVRARRHEFQAVIEGTSVTLRMRGGLGSTDPALGEAGWRMLATGTMAALEAGRVTNVEFWHADQTLQFWADGELVAHGTYDWSPAERIANATGRPMDDLLREEERRGMENILADGRLFDEPEVAWTFQGGPVTLHRVGLDRDLHYQAGRMSGGRASRATHPETTLSLNGDQFFTCGDNSPASLDGRLWEKTDPWVAAQLDPTIGVVPRDLMMGKAFFVYFPSMHAGGTLPAPDFGRMRFIW